MADGTTKPIKDIDIGDQVRATDPETGESGPRTVTAIWIHQDTVLDLVMAGGATVTTTEDHPYWNTTDHQWQQAQHLDPGDHLYTADGQPLSVGQLRLPSAHADSAYNLTIRDIHTYYVLVGQTAVLVHNDLCDEVPEYFGGVNDARNAARSSAGLGDDAVPFVQEIGPFKGRVTGMQSPDGRRGWRIDFDPNDPKKAFHFNWWVRDGAKRSAGGWKSGANVVTGGTYDDYLSLISHFPSS